MRLLRAARRPADPGQVTARERVDQTGLAHIRSTQEGNLRKATSRVIGAVQRACFETEIGDSRMLPNFFNAPWEGQPRPPAVSRQSSCLRTLPCPQPDPDNVPARFL